MKYNGTIVFHFIFPLNWNWKLKVKALSNRWRPSIVSRSPLCLSYFYYFFLNHSGGKKEARDFEFDSAGVDICGFELPGVLWAQPLKMTWSIVAIANTTTLSRVIPVLPVANGWWIPRPPSTLAQSFVFHFYFFAVRPFHKFRGCAKTQTCMYLFTSCVWPSLSKRWKWGLARSNLNLFHFCLSREWVKGERERERGDLELPFLITWRASRILAKRRRYLRLTPLSLSENSVVFSPLILTGVFITLNASKLMTDVDYLSTCHSILSPFAPLPSQPLTFNAALEFFCYSSIVLDSLFLLFTSLRVFSLSLSCFYNRLVAMQI